MDETAQDIRQREQQSTTNETPAVVDDGDGGGGSSGSSLPVPSINRKHMAVIGAVVVAIVAWKLYQRQSSSSGGSLAEDRENINKRQEAEAAPEEEEERERINVPIDPSDPLAADKAVTEALRDSGKLKDPEDER